MNNIYIYMIFFASNVHAQECYCGLYSPFLSGSRFFVDVKGDTAYVSQFTIIASIAYKGLSDTLVKKGLFYSGRNTKVSYKNSDLYLKGKEETAWRKVNVLLRTDLDCAKIRYELEKRVLWDKYDFTGMSFKEQRAAAVIYETISLEEAEDFLRKLKH